MGLSQCPPASARVTGDTSPSHEHTQVCKRKRQVGFAEALDTSGERNRGVRDVVVVFGLS